MRLLGFIAALLITLASPAQNLRYVLKTNGIPENTFSASELDQDVNAAAAARDDRVLVVYMRVDKDNLLSGNPQLIQFSRDSGVVVRSSVKPEDANRCCGSPDGVEFIGDFTILSFHINPSAATMLVLGKYLNLVTTLFGFDVREVAPGKIVFIENMIHFAPVHPERLQLADLRSGRQMELYPPKDDPLRAEFAREHAEHLPSKQTCMQMNDPCRPELYDETIEFIENDQKGNFVIKVQRDAIHATTSGQTPESVWAAVALYRYAWNGRRWMYCEQRLPDDEAERDKVRRHPESLRDKADCTPALPVVPDISNAEFSPFDRHRLQ